MNEGLGELRVSQTLFYKKYLTEIYFFLENREQNRKLNRLLYRS